MLIGLGTEYLPVSVTWITHIFTLFYTAG